VSDFDLLLVGTRGIAFDEPLPSEQIELCRWCCKTIERVRHQHTCRMPSQPQTRALPSSRSPANDTGPAQVLGEIKANGVGSQSWTRRWLEVLKVEGGSEPSTRKYRRLALATRYRTTSSSGRPPR
jgi:hypothetical protein